MQTFFNEVLKQFSHQGMTGLLMLAIIGISVYVMYNMNKRDKMLAQQSAEKDKEFSQFLNEMTKSLKSQNDCFIAHNERAVANHVLLMEGYKNTHVALERVLENNSVVMQILCVQNQQMTAYDRAMEKIQGQLEDICKQATRIEAKTK